MSEHAIAEATPRNISGPANGTGIGFALALNPTTAEQAMKTAEWMAKSDLVPKAYQGKPHDIVIAAAMGARLGLDPFSALAGIAVVNGRPTLWGDAMLAVCQQRPDWGGMRVTWDGEGEAQAVTVEILRKGHGSYAGAFSVADAKTAGLWKKQGPWSNYPKRMLELRARSYALRGAFADALAGFHAQEEIADEPRETSATVVRTELPAVRPAAERHPLVDAETAQSNQEPEKPADERPTVDDCKAALTRLWRLNKNAANAILARWKIAQVAEMAGKTMDERQAFLDDCEEVEARALESAPAASEGGAE